MRFNKFDSHGIISRSKLFVACSWFPQVDVWLLRWIPSCMVRLRKDSTSFQQVDRFILWYGQVMMVGDMLLISCDNSLLTRLTLVLKGLFWCFNICLTITLRNMNLTRCGFFLRSNLHWIIWRQRNDWVFNDTRSQVHKVHQIIWIFSHQLG